MAALWFELLLTVLLRFGWEQPLWVTGLPPWPIVRLIFANALVTPLFPRRLGHG